MLSMNSLNCCGRRPSNARIGEQNVDSVNQHCHPWEAIQVDCSQKLEESNTMLRELCKVLVDHVKRRFKDCFENRRNLWREQILKQIRSSFSLGMNKYLRPAAK
jgi:hypothetical protein